MGTNTPSIRLIVELFKVEKERDYGQIPPPNGLASVKSRRNRTFGLKLSFFLILFVCRRSCLGFTVGGSLDGTIRARRNRLFTDARLQQHRALQLGLGIAPARDAVFISATDTKPETKREGTFDNVATSQHSEEKAASDSDEIEGESTGDEGDDENGDDGIASRRRRAVARTAFLGNKGRTRTSSGRQPRATSVGARRAGSATRARQGASATSKLMDALHMTAQGTARAKPGKSSSESGKKGRPSANVVHSIIHSTIDEMLRIRQLKPKGAKLTAAFSSYDRTMGILDDLHHRKTESRPFFYPGSTILHPGSKSRPISVRVATPLDDVHIASLRLSVFSEFTASQQGQFCSRSCQAIASRRMRGATNVVATMPETGSQESNLILGSAECSFHEFFETCLGRKRPQFSILYVTEVAVNPSFRRKGIGRNLLEALDHYAVARDVETLYLHVDVNNHGAIALYEKAGYQRVDNDEHPMYEEFTKSLNLHPGATKGRNHFLLYKDLTPVPTWLAESEISTAGAKQLDLVGSLGFEIPA